MTYPVLVRYAHLVTRLRTVPSITTLTFFDLVCVSVISTLLLRECRPDMFVDEARRDLVRCRLIEPTLEESVTLGSLPVEGFYTFLLKYRGILRLELGAAKPVLYFSFNNRFWVLTDVFIGLRLASLDLDVFGSLTYARFNRSDSKFLDEFDFIMVLFLLFAVPGDRPTGSLEFLLCSLVLFIYLMEILKSGASSTQVEETKENLVLHLQPPRRNITWGEDVVDNEHMNKRKSNLCCIYKKPKRWSESESDSSSCDSCDERNEYERP